MEVQDRRVRRTQHLLTKALIALTLEKGYEAVTIRDITELADVGYATFFRHYHDKDELLKDVLEVQITELTELLRTPSTDPTVMGVLLFRYVQEHHEVIRILLGNHGLRQNLLKTVIETTTNVATTSNTISNAESIVPPEIITNHIVASSIALIEWWLDNQMPYPAERMGLIYEALIMRSKQRVDVFTTPKTS